MSDGRFLHALRQPLDRIQGGRSHGEAGVARIVFFPLYPHYAGATSATANDQFFRA